MEWNSLPFSDYRLVPNASGVYLILCKGIVLYAGSSYDLCKRLCAHNGDERFIKHEADELRWRLVSDPKQLTYEEMKEIITYRPLLHKGRKDTPPVPKGTFMKGDIPRSKLVSRTIELLRNRPEGLTIKRISEDTSLPEGWLWSLQNENNKYEPGADRIVTLYEYLTHSTLNIP